MYRYVTVDNVGNTTTNTSASVAQVSTAPSCRTITPYWFTGLEYGMLKATSLSGNTNPGPGLFTAAPSANVTVDNSVVRTGAYSMHINDNSNQAVNAQVQIWPAAGQLVLRFGIRLVSLPSSNEDDMVEFMPSTGHFLRFGYDQGTGHFMFGYDTFTAQEATNITVAAGTWYLIDLRADMTGATSTADWQVNGSAQAQATAGQSATTFLNVFWGGNSKGSEQFNINFDDMMISTTAGDYPLGDGGSRALVPAGVTAINDSGGNLKNDDGTAVSGTSWQRLDENPPTSTLDYVKQVGGDTSAYLALGFTQTTQTGCVFGVSGLMAGRSSSNQSDSAKTALWEGGTERVIYSGDMKGTTQKWWSTGITPASGGWTTTKINGLTARLGYYNGVGAQPYWDALVVEYDGGP